MVGDPFYNWEIVNGSLQLKQSVHQGGPYLHVLFLKGKVFIESWFDDLPHDWWLEISPNGNEGHKRNACPVRPN